MTDEHAQQGDEAHEDDREVGGYGDQGEAEALAQGSEPVPEDAEDPDTGDGPREPTDR